MRAKGLGKKCCFLEIPARSPAEAMQLEILSTVPGPKFPACDYAAGTTREGKAAGRSCTTGSTAHGLLVQDQIRRIGSTYLRCADFVERYESECLGHHGCGKILFRQDQWNEHTGEKQLR